MVGSSHHQLAVPSSPSTPSKRERSHDSIRSTAAVASLSMNSSPSLSARGDDSASEEAPLPWFLRQKKTETHSKFVELEWQQRNRLVQSTTPSQNNTTSPSQWARVTGEAVSQRNRYLNVDPFANNRVQLKVPEGHDDYINASPIVLKTKKSGAIKNFIATQGPKDNTHHHIWRMIWHECASPAVVLMLTQTHESGREKCFQYFPHSMEAPYLTINEHDEFEDALVLDITLKTLNEDEKTRSTIRELELRDRQTGETKTVWHILFSAWPDFSVPEGADKLALLELIPLSQQKNPAPENPRIVHCSAGVGRSGTFIALDYLLAELDEGSLDAVPDGRDPIEEVVEKLRTQRMMMVQGETQFMLLYETLREKWVERWRQRMGLPSAPYKHPEEVLGGEEKKRQAKVAKLARDLEAEMRQNASLGEKL
ncbi:uncharacterized protein K452DRAFT_146294 [Aplosporella prunicola CBS 121167]|uniref:Tyrosine specific protein phosphatases domain-containing protein n=1 Tax=Aplosporella prunicola CBS 121167 TaxID=1176127 RepID=A0A6A6BN87_9PEZI|nr:uncharacterized protein K452DRAFT_146294 [Aplosporella prunicola CBS 121167]KAF2144735.1 hypothetical protein K452DRAFT_146294 [Aplosporella prunicola CBS 121167]